MAFAACHRHRCATLPAGTSTSRRSAGRAPIRVCAQQAGAPAAKAPASIKYVKDIMTTGSLFSVTPEDTIDLALEMLVENRITGLPVLNKADGTVVGVVSDFDLLALDSLGRTNEANNLFPANDQTWKAFKDVKVMLAKTAGKKVGDVMTKNPITVKPDTTLNDATSILLSKKIRRLPVVDEKNKLIGLISRGNIVKAALMARKAE